MARSSLLPVCLLAVVFVITTAAQASIISPVGLDIQNMPYRALSTMDPVPGIGDLTTIQKASGIVPSVGGGLVTWADGRYGRVAIMGFDLSVLGGSEFLVSDEASVPNNEWQKGNPFSGLDLAGNRRVVYDATHVKVANGDLGDIKGSCADCPPAPQADQWLHQSNRLQRNPVVTQYAPAGICLAWVDHPGSTPKYPGYINNAIYILREPEFLTGVAPVVAPTPKNITGGDPAPRDHLAADGGYLTWQELRTVDLVTQQTSWDIVLYDLNAPAGSRRTYLDGPVATRNQITPDISNSLLVFTQEEDPSGTHATNVYFQDLASVVGPIAITTTGTAAFPAVSRFMTKESGKMIETAFVVWQDHRGDNTLVDYPREQDYSWDIWAQELRISGGTGEWDLYANPFLVWSDVGRQVNPDIDGLMVVWQSQAPGSEDIYVWGAPIPEPCTALVLTVGIAALVGRRRRRTGR